MVCHIDTSYMFICNLLISLALIFVESKHYLSFTTINNLIDFYMHIHRTYIYLS